MTTFGVIALIIGMILIAIIIVKKITKPKDDFEYRMDNTRSFWEKCCAKLKGKEYGI